jgi:hypothetical protein
MQKTRQTSPYEVVCPRCDVTFPIETRHCIHCGGPVGRGRGLLAAVTAASSSPAPETAEVESDDDLPRRTPFSLMSLLWLVLIVGGAAYRACTEG